MSRFHVEWVQACDVDEAALRRGMILDAGESRWDYVDPDEFRRTLKFNSFAEALVEARRWVDSAEDGLVEVIECDRRVEDGTSTWRPIKSWDVFESSFSEIDYRKPTVILDLTRED